MSETETFIPFGAEVRITKDVRPGRPAEVHMAKFIGLKKEGWVLFNDKGEAEQESRELPEDYTEWDPKTQEWPKVKCGVAAQNPYFRLEDGSIISGIQCFWEFTDKELDKKYVEELLQELPDAAKRQVLEELKSQEKKE